MHSWLSTGRAGTRCTLSALTPKLSSRQRLIIVQAPLVDAAFLVSYSPLARTVFQVLLETVTRVRSSVVSPWRVFCRSEANPLGAIALSD